MLREASRWLSRLTDGRYPSITTAIDEAKLEVHDADGTIWNPERLSRGTREQVFLALRLALIRDLGRHDVSLPVVMDDALVNFDDARARSAARVLVEFVAEQASDRQMLVLTCHEHVARTFAAAGAHVRAFHDPKALWQAPAHAVTVVESSPQPRPDARAAIPSVPPPEAARDEDLWPAEAFFFGRGAATKDAQARRPAPEKRPHRKSKS